MAQRAIGREASLRVVWVLGAGEVLSMAAHAGRRRARVPVSDVAGSARDGRVRASQRKMGEGRVVELRRQEGVHAVARVACGPKARCGVIRLRRSVEIPHVARRAGGAQARELPRGGPGVAGVALHHGVGAQQRKTIQVVLDVLHRHRPALDGVALRAIGAKLPAVNVGVAVRAARAGLAEDQLGVAQRALDPFVHATQRITGLRVVIELGDGPHRLPVLFRVATRARNLQRSVRAVRGPPLKGLRTEHGRHAQRQQERAQRTAGRRGSHESSSWRCSVHGNSCTHVVWAYKKPPVFP